MKNLKPIYEAQGYTGRSFARAVGTTPPILSYINKDIVNPTPQLLAKMLIQLNLPAQDVITPGEFDYGLPEGKGVAKAKRPDRRSKPSKTVCRTSAEKRGLFMAACAVKGITMQDAIERYMDSCIKWYLETHKGDDAA